jgi:hypothetical protein
MGTDAVIGPEEPDSETHANERHRYQSQDLRSMATHHLISG